MPWPESIRAQLANLKTNSNLGRGSPPVAIEPNLQIFKKFGQGFAPVAMPWPPGSIKLNLQI
jgi:hypothetical protein